MITRRDTTRLLLGTAAAALVPGVSHGATREEWIAILGERLAQATPPGCGTTLSLVSFGVDKKGGNAGMSAVVQMDWSPGFRKRRFDASARGEQATYDLLVADIVREFARANPGCVA